MRVAVFTCLAAVGIFLLYGIQGNSEDTSAHGGSAILWMVRRWSGSGGDLSHGWIIPLVSLYALWRGRRDLLAAPRTVHLGGLAVVVLALLLHWVGVRAQQTRISLFSLILLLWGIPFYLCGWKTARLLVFPCSYLIFCIPLSFLNDITVPLRILASSAAAALINGLGIPAVRTGSIIRSVADGGFALEVADPCSGLRSLLALTALTAAYAHFTQPTLTKKWILFVSAIPIAIAANITRIVATAVAAQWFGMRFALDMYHNLSGYVVFLVGALLVVAIGKLLTFDFGGQFQRWKLARNTLS